MILNCRAPAVNRNKSAGPAGPALIFFYGYVNGSSV